MLEREKSELGRRLAVSTRHASGSTLARRHGAKSLEPLNEINKGRDSHANKADKSDKTECELEKAFLTTMTLTSTR